MNVLIAMGSFKDVYSPIEMSQIVSNAISGHNVLQIPMCDGGEYTYDVLSFHKECSIEIVNDVLNPYGKKVTCRYLAIDNAAFIVSSEILRLQPAEDKYKNPLFLTDFGLGQLVKDAINKKYKRINICIGGTSTVSFGIGFAQALGVRFFDSNGLQIETPITTEMITEINRIEKTNLSGVELNIINDGITTASDLKNINPQKIGVLFDPDKDMILKKLDDILQKTCSITGINTDTPFAGNGGGIRFGIECVTNAKYTLGTVYFMDLLGISKIIKNYDVVITGEGKLDNVYLEKLPVSICKATKKNNKKSIFICGQMGRDVTEQDLQKYGINQVICCSDHYPEYSNRAVNDVSEYKQLTPLVIECELKKLGL